MTEFDNLTWLHGKPQGSGLLKANPEDFVVVEDLGFTPDGEGEHILLRILKNGCNTRFVADALAKFLKIHAREVSFAGQKDKHAVTEQWLCARVPGKEMPDFSARYWPGKYHERNHAVANQHRSGSNEVWKRKWAITVIQ